MYLLLYCRSYLMGLTLSALHFFCYADSAAYNVSATQFPLIIFNLSLKFSLFSSMRIISYKHTVPAANLTLFLVTPIAADIYWCIFIMLCFYTCCLEHCYCKKFSFIMLVLCFCGFNTLYIEMITAVYRSLSDLLLHSAG